jgi:hypothetical protein
MDLGTVYLTYRLARTLWPPHLARSAAVRGALLAGLAVSLAVLPVQLAHFYAADTILVFFVMLTLNLAADVARGGDQARQLALGAAFGLALATKVSAALLILVVFVAFRVRGTDRDAQVRVLGPQLSAVFRRLIPPLAVAAFVFVLVQPYALIDWRTFLSHTIRESQVAWGMLDVPYTRQYAGTWPYLYPIWQTVLWGLGLLLGLAAWAGLATVLIGWLRHGFWGDWLLLAWAGPYLVVTGAFYARYLRYMLPLVPILCILAVWSLMSLKKRWLRPVGYGALGMGVLAYALAFVSIYTEPHSWVTASEWIYRNVPAGSRLAVEEWDTALPLPLDVDGVPRRFEEYSVRTLTLYDEPDDGSKWESLVADLADSDYLIVASRRLYGSIPRLPERYPVATRYYERLFAGDLGFELAEEFTRGPVWLNPRVPPLSDAAPATLRPDESFVVYDHPRVLIFRNAGRLPAGELLRRVQ